MHKAGKFLHKIQVAFGGVLGHHGADFIDFVGQPFSRDFVDDRVPVDDGHRQFLHSFPGNEDQFAIRHRLGVFRRRNLLSITIYVNHKIGLVQEVFGDVVAVAVVVADADDAFGQESHFPLYAPSFKIKFVPLQLPRYGFAFDQFKLLLIQVAELQQIIE